MRQSRDALAPDLVNWQNVIPDALADMRAPKLLTRDRIQHHELHSQWRIAAANKLCLEIQDGAFGSDIECWLAGSADRYEAGPEDDIDVIIVCPRSSEAQASKLEEYINNVNGVLSRRFNMIFGCQQTAIFEAVFYIPPKLTQNRSRLTMLDQAYFPRTRLPVELRGAALKTAVNF